MKKMRVAVIGCGAIAHVHAACLFDEERAEIAAFVDTKRERAESFCDSYAPEAHVYTDYREMLAVEKPDAVHICTPHYLHAEMAAAAMEAGVAVLLEKPMGITEEELAFLIDTERRTGGRCTVSFQNRLLPRTKKLLELTEAHGGAVSGFGYVVWKRDEAYYTESGWRGSYKTEGGGVMINQAIHTLDLALLAFGTPIGVTATVANRHLAGIIEVEDTCEARLTFEGERTLLFYATTAHGRSIPVHLELVCRDGTVVELAGNGILENGEKIVLPEPIQKAHGKPDWGLGHAGLIEAFYEALLTDAPMPITLESAALAVRTLLAAYRSEGHEVTLNY